MKPEKLEGGGADRAPDRINGYFFETYHTKDIQTGVGRDCSG
jgi:hypothetical protein